MDLPAACSWASGPQRDAGLVVGRSGGGAARCPGIGSATIRGSRLIL